MKFEIRTKEEEELYQTLIDDFGIYILTGDIINKGKNWKILKWMATKSYNLLRITATIK